MSAWSDHVIWWQLHPLSFTGAPGQLPAPPGPPAHRLPKLRDWLGYLIELGANGLLLGPVFESGTHGYDTIDHLRIDPRLGDEADWDDLVAACRERGVKILLDGVFNHVGRDFPQFRDVLEHRGASEYADWFHLDLTATDAPDGFGYRDFEGHGGLVALNHDNPAVRRYTAGVMRHWLDRGADGWRLDAAYQVPPAFWAEVVGEVRATHPDAWFLGEVIHGDYREVVREAGLDSVTQYELWKSVWSSLNDANFWELDWTLTRHNELTSGFVPQTFVGNHDVTRIASRLDDPRHLGHALAVLFTVAGVPSVYAGDEQAFRGVKYERVDGDAEIRPAFPESPHQLADFGLPVYRLHQDLIGLRRRHPWLTRCVTRKVELTNETFAYEAVPPEGEPGLAVLLNVSDEPCGFGLDRPVKWLLGSAPDGSGTEVEGHGWAIVEFQA
ncbi:alpha-amylase family protein [Kineosporia sp. J2-2]|uniref:Alpha-amylase family protein n=1 Tax=Kineosporia corallincola TaxID=2835133 RepID=A0ABS5TDT6_9ACTN|nr:alpha-amylase family protein [Kineosporia corallincola]MBT0768998.1 alpha-amylase family protein [Kineosporia corallincola]